MTEDLQLGDGGWSPSLHTEDGSRLKCFHSVFANKKLQKELELLDQFYECRLCLQLVCLDAPDRLQLTRGCGWL